MEHRSDDNERQLAGEPARKNPRLAGDNGIWRAVVESAIELVQSSALESIIPQILERVGKVCGVSRVELYERTRQPTGGVTSALRYAWHAPDVPSSAQVQNPEARSGPESCRVTPLPEKGETLALLSRSVGAPLRGFLTMTGVQSLLLAPVFVGNVCWGEIDFEDCERERTWSDIESNALRLLAEMIGAAIERARDLQELSDVDWIVEQSPVLLYRVGGKPPYPLTYISRGVRRYGYEVRDLLASPGRYLELFHPDDRPDMMANIGAIAAGRTGEVLHERRLQAADGHYVWFEDRTRGHGGPRRGLPEIEGLMVDISERKSAEAKLAYISLSDPVTGLPNRKAFMVELDRAYAIARRGGPAFAIHYIDLDRFKDINDVFGHSKGDELLRAVAERLERVRRKNVDVIARFGGDEFAILQIDIAEPSDAGALAARLIEVVAEPFNLGTEIHVTASIGIAIFTPEVQGTEEMIKRVDLALYRAKDLGRNQFHFHSEALDAATIDRVMLGGDLQRALDRGELKLEYQPQVEIATGRIVGLEALARWTHPKLGPIGPARFVPIAESTGTILPLGHWVIDAVCRQIADWRAAGLKPPPVAFNVSAGQLKGSSEFDRDLAERLRHWAVEPRAIEIELTESVLMETTQRHREIIERLRMLGVPIAIDDFGTGYSSLTYLRTYHVDHIKVAQEFIHDIRPGSGDIAVVRAAISLGRELDIPVIAEGVESEFQLDLVRGAGCQFVQGYYFSPPVSPARVVDLLRRGTLKPESG